MLGGPVGGPGPLIPLPKITDTLSSPLADVMKVRSLGPSSVRSLRSCHSSSLTRTLSVLEAPDGVGAEMYVSGDWRNAKVWNDCLASPSPSTSPTVWPWVAFATLP